MSSLHICFVQSSIVFCKIIILNEQFKYGLSVHFRLVYGLKEIWETQKELG